MYKTVSTISGQFHSNRHDCYYKIIIYTYNYVCQFLECHHMVQSVSGLKKDGMSHDVVASISINAGVLGLRFLNLNSEC